MAENHVALRVLTPVYWRFEKCIRTAPIVVGPKVDRYRDYYCMEEGLDETMPEIVNARQESVSLSKNVCHTLLRLPHEAIQCDVCLAAT